MPNVNSLIAGGSACLGALLEKILKLFQKGERERKWMERRSGWMSATTVKRIVSS